MVKPCAQAALVCPCMDRLRPRVAVRKPWLCTVLLPIHALIAWTQGKHASPRTHAQRMNLPPDDSVPSNCFSLFVVVGAAMEGAAGECAAQGQETEREWQVELRVSCAPGAQSCCNGRKSLAAVCAPQVRADKATTGDEDTVFDWLMDYLVKCCCTLMYSEEEALGCGEPTACLQTIFKQLNDQPLRNNGVLQC